MKTTLNYKGVSISLECTEEYEYLYLFLLDISNSLYVSSEYYKNRGYKYLSIADGELFDTIQKCLVEIRLSKSEDKSED